MKKLDVCAAICNVALAKMFADVRPARGDYRQIKMVRLSSSANAISGASESATLIIGKMP